MKKKEIIEYIVSWLRNYCETNGLNGFVTGISGGIDSALTSALCAKTGKNTLVMSLPIRQHKPEHDRAHEHITWLRAHFPNVNSYEIDLTGVFEKMESVFPENVLGNFLTMANARARLRMTTLYAFAGQHRMLVAGTGNKVEDFGVGFYTKYGDGGVDISPIADLMKSEVCILAKELGIVNSILKAPPTDGLWPDKRTDEDQLEASYDELEWAMKMAAEQKTPDNFSGRQKTVMEIFLRLNKANRHKMLPIPVCTIPAELRG